MEQTKKGWFSCLLTYAGAGRKRMIGSVILSVISVTAGLLPYYCVFRLIEAFATGALNEAGILTWCGLALPVVSIIALTVMDWRVALASLVTVPFSLVCMVLTFQISGKNFDQYVRSNTAMSSTIVEYIEGIEVIKAFGRAGASYDKYAKAITDYHTFVVKWLSSTWVTFKLAFALFPSTLLGTLPMCLWLGVMLSMSMVTSLAKIEVFANEIKQMQMTVEELQRYLDMPELPEPEQRASLSGYDVSLHNVCFSYTGKKSDEVLHGVNLNLPQGSVTALVGPSGGGKSTVAKLIARFWDVTGGKITIGGVNIRDIPLLQLADTVSFVTQDNFLFRCSLKENIRLGNPSASDDEVLAAAKAAQCEEFIQKLPQGWDTPAGEAGKRLSGGEKQRIAIARMILKSAPVVILDEAAASIDPENEHLIQAALSELTRGKTIITIAHRLATIQNADQILVVDDGRIVQRGTHPELVSQPGRYRNFVETRQRAEGWNIA